MIESPIGIGTHHPDQSTAISRSLNEFPGGHRSRVTPVPIPNTEVKPATVDGTARAGAWESRSLPGIYQRSPSKKSLVLFSCTIYRAQKRQPIIDYPL